MMNDRHNVGESSSRVPREVDPLRAIRACAETRRIVGLWHGQAAVLVAPIIEVRVLHGVCWISENFLMRGPT